MICIKDHIFFTIAQIKYNQSIVNSNSKTLALV